MALDYQKVREQIRKLGEAAPQRERQLQLLRDRADATLTSWAEDGEKLRSKIERAAETNRFLSCAMPTEEALNLSVPLPEITENAHIIAADGSQINPDWHSEVEYCLVNVGAIEIEYGTGKPPQPVIQSEMFYHDALYTEHGSITEALVALIRDQSEREMLARLAEESKSDGEVITLTDGPIELWGGNQPSAEFTKRFEMYMGALSRLQKVNATTAGYVDNPRSDLVVRMLEIAVLADDELNKAGHERSLRGVRDKDIFFALLEPGARSALFGIQSKSAQDYKEELALHFFYLNVSLRPNKKWIVRVEVPAWVAEDENKLNTLHAVLVDQCQILANKPFPYLLHRAHETAIVTREEKQQVDQMIMIELRNRGVEVKDKSNKQFHKDNK